MILSLLALGCSTSAPEHAPVAVRAGWITDRGEQALGDGRFLTQLDLERPRQLACVPIVSVELGDLRRRVAAGITAPDTALAFSPDGRWLAIGSYLGELLVVDAWSGEVRARRTLAESAVKRVAWSPAGDVLYAAEQSVEGVLRAVDPATLQDRARFVMAEHLERSAPPDPSDLYGLYTLPGPYGLHVLDDGDVVLVGAHGWNAADGRRNRSQVWRLDPQLEVRARWPAQPADATFLASAIDDDRVVVAVSRSATGPAPDGIGVGGVAVLDGQLKLLDTLVPEPLEPYYERAFVWEAIALHDGRLTLGLADGRIWRVDRRRALSTPIDSAGVPIAATIGSLVDTGGLLLTSTSGTSVPYGLQRAETEPPSLHPAENTLFALDPSDLSTVWTWRGDEALAGLSQRGRWLALGVAPRDGEPSRHGVLVFDLERPGERLAASCTTGQPVFFRTAIAADGRIAVASFPEKRGSGVEGAYRVQIFL